MRCPRSNRGMCLAVLTQGLQPPPKPWGVYVTALRRSGSSDLGCRRGGTRTQDVRWTYHELSTKVLSFAAALKDLGYKPGEKLCMALDSGAPNVVAQLAAAVVGADVVPTPYPDPPSKP